MATHDVHRKRPVALIVEDEPLLRELAAALLEESGLRVVECEDAEQAHEEEQEPEAEDESDEEEVAAVAASEEPEPAVDPWER